MTFASRLPDDEALRLSTLQEYRILDTPAEERFDRITRLVAKLFGAPICLISLVDSDRQWFKSRVGLDLAETPREHAFCAHAILEDDVFVVPDATEDLRFAANPFVIGPPYIRTYVGAPLIARGGVRLGTICLIYSEATSLPSEVLGQLKQFAAIVVDEIDLRCSLKELARSRADALYTASRLAVEIKKSKTASNAKKTFLATMSHEIRTPLNAILGMAHALRGAAQDEADCDKIDVILDSGRTLLALLDNVLDISRIEAGKLEIHPAPGDIRQSVRQTCDLFESQAREKGLTLKLEVSEDVPGRLSFDDLRVRQCLMNLISNAVKFTHRGEVRVTVTSRRAASGNVRMIIEVSDTGIGMNEQTRSRLFETFSQGDASTTRRYGGTGLGLAIARKLARLMNGDILARSVEGRGSLMTLEFLAESLSFAENLHSRPSADPEPAAFKYSPLAGATILVVDDNEINRKLIRLMLASEHSNVIEAQDGRQALAKLANCSVDLVLLDVQMPVMDGEETVKRIRNSPREWRDVPVIALTANAFPGERERLLALGMTEFLAKPVDERALISKMESLLISRSGMLEKCA
jgi:signal transduction histidine kinase/CheY-like chemotaxis protein